MKIIIRADSSSNIGFGHISRCLVLAKKYKRRGFKVLFACENLEGNRINLIEEEGFKVYSLKSNNLKEFKTLVNKLNPYRVVIDSYRIDYSYEKKLKKNTKIKLLCFDDTYEKHYCDELLNHNVCAIKKRYKKLVPKFCKVKCGSKYTLLRDEFLDSTKVKIKSNKKKLKVLLAIGGTDHSFINIKVLQALKVFQKNIKISVITTSANKNLVKLKKYISKQKNIQLLINSNNIAKQMSKSNIAIITPSVTLNEVMYMKLPFIAIKTASNQKFMYSFLKKNNYIVLDKFIDKTVQKEFKNLVLNYKKYYNKQVKF